MIHLDYNWFDSRGIDYVPIYGPNFIREHAKAEPDGPVLRTYTYHAETEEEAERFFRSARALHVDNYRGIVLSLGNDYSWVEKPGCFVNCWCLQLHLEHLADEG